MAEQVEEVKETKKAQLTGNKKRVDRRETNTEKMGIEKKKTGPSWQPNGHVTSALVEWQVTQPPLLGEPGSWAKWPRPSEFFAHGEVSVMGLLSWLLPRLCVCSYQAD